MSTKSDDVVAVEAKSLCDHHPLVKHQCGSDREMTVICPEYDTM